MSENKERINIRGGKKLSPAYEPGVVEVLFKENAKIRMEDSPPSSERLWSIITRAKADIDVLNKLLTDLECDRVRRVFTSSTEEEYDALQERVIKNHSRLKEKPPVARNLNDFFTIHFPPTMDPVEVAKRLEELDIVEKASPVPIAVPPHYDFEHFEFDRYCNMMQIVGPCRVLIAN